MGLCSFGLGNCRCCRSVCSAGHSTLSRKMAFLSRLRCYARAGIRDEVSRLRALECVGVALLTGRAGSRGTPLDDAEELRAVKPFPLL